MVVPIVSPATAAVSQGSSLNLSEHRASNGFSNARVSLSASKRASTKDSKRVVAAAKAVPTAVASSQLLPLTELTASGTRLKLSFKTMNVLLPSAAGLSTVTDVSVAATLAVSVASLRLAGSQNAWLWPPRLT